MTEALILLSMFLMIAVGLPIAFAILGSALIGVWLLNGHLGFLNAALSLYDGATSFPLIAIPLFILAGALMNTGGISSRLIAFVSALIGFVRGGLAMVNVGVSMFFAEISGSAVADVAATGSVLIPAMKKKGYSPRFAARDHLVLGLARDHHSAVDPDDPLRRPVRYLDRQALRCRYHAGHRGRVPPDGAQLLLRGALRPAARGPLRPLPAVAYDQGGLLGADPAGHHPRRHLRRPCHRDRGRSACGARGARHRAVHLPGTGSQAPLSRAGRRRAANRDGHASGRDLCGAWPLPHRNRAAAAAGARDHHDHHEQARRADDHQRPSSCSSAWCCTARRRSS